MLKKSILISMVLAMFLVLTGCQKSEFSFHCNEDNTASGEFTNAAVGDWAGAGTITLEKGQKFVIDASKLEKGKLEISFGQFSGPETETNNKGVLEIKAGAASTIEIDPGDYVLNCKILEKATGTLSIYVE